jgi:hypothetical protein
LLTFLYIARGSAGEVRSMLCLFEKIPALANLQSPISNLKPKAESISRQLRAWAEALQNSDIKGQRYLNGKLREDQKRAQAREERKRELEEFDAELKRIVEEGRKKREGIGGWRLEIGNWRLEIGDWKLENSASKWSWLIVNA